ncbi:zinc ribbon domain-containing protein [Candidatus Calescamantes bacterium]|nr:zinc ribbon domain-containing protein [Candidatus Calescamantes bacterium]
MPTYEYQCKNCGYRFEKFQSIKEEAIKTCPKCGGEVQRLFSGGGGFIFKGPGFYATDYKKPTCCPNPCDNPKRCCEK